MSSSPAVGRVLLLGLVTPWLAAQRPPEQPVGRQLPKATDADALWRVPIHTHRGSPDYGWWAAERGYKVSFHDGFEFHPYLGPDYPENLPLRWRTVSVTAGGDELLRPGEAPHHARSDWRYEYRFARLVEAYDVTPDGVEQTFTIHQRPPRAGAIVVRGEVTGRLRAAPVAERHGPIAFADAAGRERVVYGAAWAADARGRQTDVRTSFDGRHVDLELDAQFVAAATFPVVIDPLTTPVVTSTWGGATWGLPVDSSIGREDESPTANVVIAHARQFSASDFDLYVGLYRDDFGHVATLFSHITTAYVTRRPSVASVGGANRWVVAYDVQDAAATFSSVDAYVHDFGNTAFGSGTVLSVASGSGFSRYPRVGGQRSWTAGAYALVVFQHNPPASSNGEVYGRLIDAGNPTGAPPRPPRVVGPNVYLAGAPAGPGLERELPCINQESGGGDASWIVGWQEQDWSQFPVIRRLLRIARISPFGVAPSVVIGPGTGPYQAQLRLAGRDGRYLASFLRSDFYPFVSDLYVQRVDWPETSASPTLGALRPVVQGRPALANGAVAYDTLSASHWGLVWTEGAGQVATSDVFAARVGFTGGVVERQTVYERPATGAFDPSVTFDQRVRSFMIAYCTYELTQPLLPVYAVRLYYSTAADSVAYGTGCGGTISSTRPDAGTEFFRVALAAGAASASQPGALLIGVQPASGDLSSIGMPGCFLNTNVIASFGAMTDANGDAAIVMSLQDEPAFLGDIYFQWAFGSPPVPWPLKVATTAGLRVRVR